MVMEVSMEEHKHTSRPVLYVLVFIIYIFVFRLFVYGPWVMEDDIQEINDRLDRIEQILIQD